MRKAGLYLLCIVALVGCSQNKSEIKSIEKNPVIENREKSLIGKEVDSQIDIKKAELIALNKTTDGILIISNTHKKNEQTVYEIGILKEEKIYSYVISTEGIILNTAEEIYMTPQSSLMSVYEATLIAFEKVGVSQLLSSQYVFDDEIIKYILLLKNETFKFEVIIDVESREVITVKEVD